jgi:DNA polymerase-3 subunit epsilon
VLLSSPPWDSVAYWALDLETGGLEPRRDPILAVGMLPVREGTIRVGEGWQTLVRPREGMAIDPASIRAHQLVKHELADAPPIEEVVPEIDRRLREGVLLVHHRAVDVAFLKRAYRRVGRRWPSPQVVDTVDLLVRTARRRRFAEADGVERLPERNLGKARAEYGLPEYQAHDALTDALATAELFLALRARLGARTLRQLR